MKKSVCFLLSSVVFLSFFSLVFAATNSSVTVNFGVLGGNCERFSDSSRWVDNQSQLINWTALGGEATNSDCFFKDDNGNYKTDNYCCPVGGSCWQDMGSRHEDGGRCVQGGNLCSDASISEGNCNGTTISDIEKVAIGFNDSTFMYTNPLTGAMCYGSEDAACVWRNGSCVADLIKIININGTVNGNCTEDETWTTCSYKFLSQDDSKCDSAEQIITINYTASFSAKYANGTAITNQSLLTALGANCTAKSQDYACSASIQLPGFSLFNFFVSILGIGMVYFFFKKNYKGKD